MNVKRRENDITNTEIWYFSPAKSLQNNYGFWSTSMHPLRPMRHIFPGIRG